MLGRTLTHRFSCPQEVLPPRALTTRTCATAAPVAPVVGIDLGTSNSAVAHVAGGRPRCIPNSDGETVTPSVVCIQPGGVALVGRQAKRLAVQHPDSTYASVKRIIGRKHDDPVVKEEARRLGYQVGKDEDGAVTLTCPNVSLGRLYPEEVSAQVLAQLLRDARRHLGAPVTKAVISVPAYFDDGQRDATIEAGKLAGLDTVRLMREPVAAALAYSLDLKEDQTVLVFDLGGGTYDISILEVGNGTIEVLSTGGDAHLGGDDFDAAIVDWLRKRYLAPHVRTSGLDLNDPRLGANLKALAEAAKEQLSDADEVTLRLPVGGPNNAPIAVPLSRRQFDDLSADLWRRCRLPVDQACWQAGVDLGETMLARDAKRTELQNKGVPEWRLPDLSSPPEIRPKKRAPITKVLAVGGSTRMPAVNRFVRNMTGLELMDTGGVDPDEAVALGAAVQAGILQGHVDNVLVIDQWQASLMRALADLKMREDPAARRAIETLFDMSEAAAADGASAKAGPSKAAPSSTPAAQPPSATGAGPAGKAGAFVRSFGPASGSSAAQSTAGPADTGAEHAGRSGAQELGGEEEGAQRPRASASAAVERQAAPEEGEEQGEAAGEGVAEGGEAAVPVPSARRLALRRKRPTLQKHPQLRERRGE